MSGQRITEEGERLHGSDFSSRRQSGICLHHAISKMTTPISLPAGKCASGNAMSGPAVQASATSDLFFKYLILILAAAQLACGSAGATDAGNEDKPLALSVSEVPTSNGGSQARFSWSKGSVYRLSVSRSNTNGTSTIMWSWEVIDPYFSVSGGITYGNTPNGASCSIHKCTATGLTRSIAYKLTVWYGNEQTASTEFTL